MPDRRRFVCAECFGDEALKDFCEGYAEARECNFCDSKSKHPIAAPLADVIEHINRCVHQHYDNPDNAGLAYESREGGYQGSTYDSWEVLEELGLDLTQGLDGELFSAIRTGLDSDLWCQTDPYALTPDQQLWFSWERFCEIIKHKHRFFFFSIAGPKPKYGVDELFSPAQTLKAIFDFAREAGGIIRVEANTRFYRARRQEPGDQFRTAGTIGPPLVEYAVQPNRMSPPGVVMTYVADDIDTALAETASKEGTFAVGTFVNRRPLQILDLTSVAEPPSIFAELSDSWEYDPRPRLGFLQAVRREISRPIARDDRVHVDYVPTQIVTEFVRTMIEFDGGKIDGIRYDSSRRNVAKALVLFADRTNCILPEKEQPEFYYLHKDRWLELTRSREVKVTRAQVRQWNQGVT